MRKLYLAPVLIVAAVGLVALAGTGSLTAGEEDRDFEARLSSYNEAPQTLSTTGHGRFKARLTSATSLEVELTFAGLEGGAAAAAHIHLGRRALAGGIIVHLCGTGGRPACPAGNTSTPATVKVTVTPADVTGPAGQGIAAGEFAELVRALRAGAAYVNVHNATYPAGEIRGQIEDE